MLSACSGLESLSTQLWSMSFLRQISLSLTLAVCLAPEMTESFLCKVPLPRRKLNHYHTDPSPLPASNPRGCEEERQVRGNDSCLVIPKAVMEKCPGEKVLNFHPYNPSTETQELLIATSLQGNLPFTFVFGQFLTADSEFICKVRFLLSSKTAFKVSVIANPHLQGLVLSRWSIWRCHFLQTKLQGLAGHLRVEREAGP